MRRALPAERPVLARARCWGRLVAGSDSFNHVFRPANSPVANRAAPGTVVAHGEGVPSAGASYTAGDYLQQTLQARSRLSRHAVCSRPGAGRKQCAARPQRGRDPGITQ
jgi:hypothetical protein